MNSTTSRRVYVPLDCLVRCSICERQFPSEELKEADDFDPQGNHRYLQICGECEYDFDKLDIAFNFSANTALTGKPQRGAVR